MFWLEIGVLYVHTARTGAADASDHGAREHAGERNTEARVHRFASLEAGDGAGAAGSRGALVTTSCEGFCAGARFDSAAVGVESSPGAGAFAPGGAGRIVTTSAGFGMSGRGAVHSGAAACRTPRARRRRDGGARSSRVAKRAGPAREAARTPRRVP
ncbi:MAG: hypothetical protein IPJ04_02855 [Candidatus Eisenbacteria bacterium]|nr:hypothetical protein [Candidatus Eisenbacteria bacterium]